MCAVATEGRIGVKVERGEREEGEGESEKHVVKGQERVGASRSAGCLVSF